MDPDRSLLRLWAGGLDPDREYLLLADDVERARFTTDAYGRAKLQLRYPAPDGTQALEFDPRGKLLSVSDGSEDKLSAVVSGPLEPPGIRIKEVAGIPPTDPAEAGRAVGTYRTILGARRAFEVRVSGVDPGSYEVWIDGAPVGEIEASFRGQGVIRFLSDSHPGGRFLRGHGFGRFGWRGRGWAELDFEPRGALVEIVRDGEVLFAGTMRARVALPEEDVCPVVDIEQPFTRVRSAGAGEAFMRSKDQVCEHEFWVTIRGLAVANYELWVGEALVGTVPVRNWPGGSSGEVHFDSDPDDPDELPLEFDPRGQLIEIRRPVSSPGLLFLEALFPTE
jgi:hypothetical protein